MNRHDRTRSESTPSLDENSNIACGTDKTCKADHEQAEMIRRLVSGSESEQERAVSLLCQGSMAEFTGEVQTLLSDSKLLQEFKGELIRALIHQRVNCLMTMNKDGVLYQFNPSLLDDPDKLTVIVQTRRQFAEYLEGNNVLSTRFANQILDQEILETLPMDFTEYDPERLAASIIRLVFQEMRNEKGWTEFEQKYYSGGFEPYPLRIEMRGKN